MGLPQTMRMRSREMSQEELYRDLNLEDVRKLIDEGYEVVDVREDWEWNKGHIPGARHVVLASLLANPTRHEFRDKSIFVCEVGERTAVASELAVALGTREVVNFRGGTKAWREAGLPSDKVASR